MRKLMKVRLRERKAQAMRPAAPRAEPGDPAAGDAGARPVIHLYPEDCLDFGEH